MLGLTMAFFNAVDLSLADHVHHCVALEGAPGSRERAEPEAGRASALAEPMNLFNDVVQILHRTSFTMVRQ